LFEKLYGASKLWTCLFPTNKALEEEWITQNKGTTTYIVKGKHIIVFDVKLKRGSGTLSGCKMISR
jgi:hypothetical protein